MCRSGLWFILLVLKVDDTSTPLALLFECRSSTCIKLESCCRMTMDGDGAQMVTSMVGHLGECLQGVACNGLTLRICNQDCWGVNRDKEKVKQKKHHERNKRRVDACDTRVCTQGGEWGIWGQGAEETVTAASIPVCGFELENEVMLERARVEQEEENWEKRECWKCCMWVCRRV